MTSTVTRTSAPLWTTLPSRYYWAEDIYELEKERIFYDAWLYVGRVQQIPNPGDFITQDIVDESVIVVRDKQGTINAFSNVCRHRGNKLCSAAVGEIQGQRYCLSLPRMDLRPGWEADSDPEHDWDRGVSQGRFPAVPGVSAHMAGLHIREPVSSSRAIRPGHRAPRGGNREIQPGEPGRRGTEGIPPGCQLEDSPGEQHRVLPLPVDPPRSSVQSSRT